MTDLGRREVLRYGVGASGALVVAVALPACEPAKAPMPHLQGTDFVPNAWIRITQDDRVHFVLDRVEMGQGTMTSHAQLVAEELDVDPARLVIELAPADRAYDNPDSQLGFQVTGGSTSTKTSYTPLRLAAATARDMLRQAAARRWGVLPASCAAVDGAIVHRASGRHARYGELTVLAAREELAAPPALKPEKEHRFVGTSVPRLDAPSKVNGEAVYGIDVKLPGLLTAIVIRAPVMGATASSFAAPRAKTTPGVVDVFRVPTGVAVVATSYWRARRAAREVEVAWTGGHTTLDTTVLRAGFRARTEHAGHVMRKEGDVARAEGDAATVVEATYDAPYLAHATLEPQNATVHIHDGRCDAWAPTQSPGLAREALRNVTGFAYENISVHQTLLGGGYGRRLVQDMIVEAAHVALRVGKPVKVIWSREDDTANDFYRPMASSLFRASVGRDGTLQSWFHRVACQSIIGQIAEEWAGALVPGRAPLSMKRAVGRGVGTAYSGNALPDQSTVEGGRDVAYAIPNIAVEYAPIRVPVPVGWWRSVGFSFNVFGVESFFDEVARAARRDPFEARRALLGAAPRHKKVLELAAEKAKWASAPRAGVHRGIAQTCAFGTYVANVAEVTVEGSDVRVHRIVAAVDCGKVVNPDLVRAQIEGGIGFGLGAALKQEITIRGGRVQESNFHDFESLRMNEMPEIEVHIVPSDEAPTGIGEPGVPLVAPVVANAILAATGKPVRAMPIRRALEGRR